MCFELSEHSKELIAGKDIPVWKAITDDARPYIQFFNADNPFVYKFGVDTEQVPLKVVLHPFYPKIEAGYHSCVSKEHCIRFMYGNGWCTEDGNVRYGSLAHRRGKGLVFAEFVIPKGTKYYENVEGFLVSEVIRLVDPIFEPEMAGLKT